jgi:phenylacetate-CoA ligase
VTASQGGLHDSNPAGCDFLDPEEGLSRDELRQLQEERLLAMLPYVYERSALTRSVWDEARVHPRDIRSIADFTERAPFIDQDILRRFRAASGDPFAGLLCVRPHELGYVGSTSGTTGNPTPVAHTAMGPTEIARGRELHMLGARSGDAVTVILFSFRSGIDLLCERAPQMGINRLFLSHVPAEVPRLLEVSRSQSPTVLYLLSTPLIIAIDEYAREQGLDVREAFSSYRAAIYGGEPMSPWARGRLQEWGLDVAEMTAAGDGMPATECPDHAGCHVWEDLVILEHLVPGSDEPAPAGERGELVVTSLYDPGTPMIRFRTNDIVTVQSGPCRCGRSHARIRTLGRTGDAVEIAGRQVLPADIGAVLGEVQPCRASLFQVVVSERPMDVLRLRVGYERGPADLAVLREEVTTALVDRLGCGVQVELVANEELLKLGPPHKIPRTVKV